MDLESNDFEQEVQCTVFLKCGNVPLMQLLYVIQFII